MSDPIKDQDLIKLPNPSLVTTRGNIQGILPAVPNSSQLNSGTVANHNTNQYLSDKIDIQRLKGPNWATWKWQLQNILDAKGLTDVLTGTEPYGSPREVAARQIVSSSLDSSLVCKVIHCHTAQSIWSCLRGIYENKTSFALTDLIGRMNSYKMTSLTDVENGVSEIQSMASQITSLGGSADGPTIESAILRALPKSFSSFVTSWTFLDAEKRTLENLHAHLMRTVCLLRSEEISDNKDKAMVARQSKFKTNTGKNRETTESNNSSRKSLFCRYCKKTGHVVKDCRKLARKKELEEGNVSSETSHLHDKEPQGDARIKSDENQSTARVAYGHIATFAQYKQCLTASTSSEFITTSWIADSGASFHMTSHFEWIADYHEFSNPIEVRLGDNRTVQALGKGFIQTTTGVLDPVYYLPNISENLFSVASCAKIHKIFALCTDKHMLFMKDDEEIFRGQLNQFGIYEITFTMKLARYVSLLSTSLSDWHDRLAHVSPKIIKYMADNKVVEGMHISNPPEPRCEPCATSKTKRNSHPTKTTPRSTTPGQVLHFDTVGPMPELSLGGHLYYVLCKDACTSYKQVFFVSSKSEIADQVKLILAKSKLETNNDVLQIVTDNGTEYLNSNLQKYLLDKGITHSTSAAYTPQQNGLIEREIRTVAEAARTIRIQSGLPKVFWAEAINTATYILNRVINSRNSDATPFELWHGRKPSFNNVHKFGEAAVVYTQSHSRDKLDPKGKVMKFVGYTDNHNTFRFIDPESYKLVITSDATFLNKDIISNDETKNHSDDSESVVVLDTTANLKPNEAILNQTYSINSKSEYDSDDETIDPVNINDEPSLDHNNTELNIQQLSKTPNQSLEEDNVFLTPAKPSPENSDTERIATLRPRSNRPNYMPWKINLSTLETEEDPQDFSEAMSRKDSKNWMIAMQEELQSLTKCNVWTLVNKPANKNIISNRWVYRIKRNPDGSISRYKARLVARGFSQIYGLDYSLTYAPTASMSIIRLLFAYAAIEGLELAQFDIKSAFLYGDLDEEIYMYQPDGFINDTSKVWRLNKSLYGLKQAPRQWCKRFTDFLLQLQLKTTLDDKCVFYKSDPLIIVVIYVDDGIIFARRPADIQYILDQLKQEFEIHSLELNTFLGFQIIRPNPHQIMLHQSSYVSKIIRKFQMEGFKSERSPISPCSGSTDDTPLTESIPFRQIVGSLLYAAICTRIDIAFPVGLASRGLANPTMKDWLLTKRIMRYLIGETDLSLMYRADRNEGLVTYCDADYAGCDDTSRSTTGLVILFGGAPVHWQSVRQDTVATSSTVAEMFSLSSAVNDAQWLYNFALEVGIIEPQPIRVFCDNESAIKLASNERCPQKTKHLRARFAALQELVAKKVIELSHVRSNMQLADMLTKPITIKSFVEARSKILINWKTKALFFAMLLTIITSPLIAFKFDTVKPILYQQTDKFVDDGVEQYQVDYTYDNPCELLNKFLPYNANTPGHPMHPNDNAQLASNPIQTAQHPSLQHQGLQLHNQAPAANLNLIQPIPDEAYVNTFIGECHTVYQSTWIMKVNELLSRQQMQIIPSVHGTIHHIAKRNIVTDIILGTVISNFIWTLFEPLLPWSDYNKIRELKELHQHESMRLQKFQHDFNVSIAVQKGVLDLIKSNSRSIREQNRQMIHFAELSSHITWLSTYIQTRIVFSATDLRTIIDEFIHHRVATLELSELFNMTKIRDIDPIDTQFLSVQRIAPQTLRFTFNVRLRSPDTSVYKVHAFRYWEELTHVPVLKEYHGSPYVLVNTTSNCTKGLEDVSERAVMDSCTMENYQDPKIKVWRSLISTRDIYKQDITAYKRTYDFIYVYCFPYTIVIEKETLRCPTRVFKIPSNTPFQTQNITYVPVIRKFKFQHHEHLFIEDVNTGHFEDASVAADGLRMFDRIQELTELNEKLTQREEASITIAKHGVAWWTTISTVGLLILVTIILSLINLKLSKKAHQHSKQAASDVAEMKIYDRIGCMSCSGPPPLTLNSDKFNTIGKSNKKRDEGITINVHPGTQPVPSVGTFLPGHRL